jgi:hypothetical protein
MLTKRSLQIALLSTFLISSLALAQSGDYAIPRWTISSGGGVVTRDDLTMVTTFGEPIAGQIRGGDLTLTAGFTARAVQAEERVLALYALAMDNESTSPSNLSNYYEETIQAIINETTNDPQKLAVVLADKDKEGDSHILLIFGTTRRRLDLDQLDNTSPPQYPKLHLSEFDMTDGELIGQFISWARARYSANQTFFSFIGHGLPLVAADVDAAKIFKRTQIARSAATGEINAELPIVPTHKFIHPDFTDEHPVGIISPYDLALALNIGTNNGQNPIDVLDMMHCFAASIEEFYELSNPNGPAPYAKVMIGSPNYTYFAPQLVGGALSSIRTDQTPAETAQAIVDTYDDILRKADESSGDATIVDHPRIIVAVDSSKIIPIKDAIDQFAASTLKNLNFNQVVLDAYNTTATQKYDTTYCPPQNWQLEPPDALVDVAEFTKHMGDQNIENLVNQAIVARKAAPGYPWFADIDTKPFWDIHGSGISMYLDVVGRDKGNDLTYLSWHADWYTDTITNTISVNQADNLHPYAFVQQRAVEATNADLLHQIQHTQPLTIEACLPVFPPVQVDGDLTVSGVVFPAQHIDNRETLSQDSPTDIAVVVNSVGIAPGPSVYLTFTDPTGAMVFSNTVSAGRLVTGTYWVKASRQFTPTTTGIYTLTATIDPENKFIEGDKEIDNTKIWTYTVIDPFGRPTITATVQNTSNPQWISSDNLTSVIEKDRGTNTIKRGFEVQVYQWIATESGQRQAPISKFVDKRPDVTINEPDTTETPPFDTKLVSLAPGAVEMHIWGIDGQHLTKGPAIVKFNYTPSITPIQAGAEHYYIFTAKKDERSRIDLDVLGEGATDLKVKLWYEENSWDADLHGDENGIIDVTALYTGTYYVAVENKGALERSYRLKVEPLSGDSIRIAPAATGSLSELLQANDEPEFRPVFQPVIPHPPTTAPDIEQFFLPLIMYHYAAPLPDLTISKLVATSNNMQVVVQNQGNAPVYNEFWVDSYIDPSPIPTGTNQIWPGLSFQGLVWAVTAPALPLPPGSVITLTVGDAFYVPALSVFTPTLTLGTPVYAQVDSANAGVPYGAVLEADERAQTQYNNILSTTVTFTLILPVIDTHSSAIVSPQQMPVRPEIKERQPAPVDKGAAKVNQSANLEQQAVLTSTLWIPLVQQ